MGCRGKAKHLGDIGRWGQGYLEGSQGRDGTGDTWSAQGWEAQRVPEDGVQRAGEVAQGMPKDGAHGVPKKGGTGEKEVPSQCVWCQGTLWH